MKMGCHKGMKTKWGAVCGHPHGGHPPVRLIANLVVSVSVLGYIVVALILVLRMVHALETIAMANSYDELEDRLSDVERADLEARIRENLFPA